MTGSPYLIKDDTIELTDIWQVLTSGATLKLSDEVRERIRGSRAYLEHRLSSGDETFYGINTGFGSLYDVKISNGEIVELQENLVRSHACGAGPEVPNEIVRIILFLKILSLGKGASGVREGLVDMLVSLYNAGINPVIRQYGSLGASGDLAPLAHLSLTLIGEGKVSYRHSIMPSKTALDKEGVTPLKLAAKEGLAMINGTQFSNAYAVWAILQAEALTEASLLCAAASLDAFNCNLSPFHKGLNAVRRHNGQSWVASRIREILKDSPIATREDKALQDPYAFRCIPQVHGASYAAYLHAREMIGNEVNAVTDNPLVLEAHDAILSGGNFHAQPVGLVMDYLAIAFSELGNISERRIYQLLSGKRELPDYLASKPGLESGMMITQYTAASLLHRNKLLANPASTDSIISSKGQEDHVSMSANAGTKLYELLENLWSILGIEWLVAMQALEFRKPLQSGERIETLREQFRLRVSPLEGDRSLSEEMQISARFLKEVTGAMVVEESK